jgi:two-component system sensor histidine kinase BaeS
MKTLFSRILLAQVVAVVLALLVVTLITRFSLNRGFTGFLLRQETTILETIAPALSDVYQRQGSWDFLRENPNNWQLIWRLSRVQQGNQQGGPPRQGQGRGRPRENERPAPPPGPEAEFRWLASPGKGKLRERLFLLDESKERIAGSEITGFKQIDLQELIVDGTVVGWIGFAPMGRVLPPEAERFLGSQVKIMFLALTIALTVAALLAWLLASNVSKPVQRLGRTVRKLSDGQYEARASDVSEDEIGVLALNVNSLAEKLEKNRTVRKRWMADIAHELRTPVAVMKGEIEAIADGVRQFDGTTIASLNEEINHLASMIDDLQALALADAGALNIQKQEVNLAEVVKLSTDSFRHRLAKKNITLKTTLAEIVHINADPQRVRQLLHNLLENSCRYVEEGGVAVISLQTNGNTILQLEDSGPGVNDEQLERLFDRFYRVEGSRSRATGGSGLGLSICKNIVEAHGGKIEADHSPLGGLLIRAIFPA